MFILQIFCPCAVNLCSPPLNICSTPVNLCSTPVNITFHVTKIHLSVDSTKLCCNINQHCSKWYIVRPHLPSIMMSLTGTPRATSESLMYSGSLIPSRLFSSPLINILSILPSLYNCSAALMRLMKNEFMVCPIRTCGVISNSTPTLLYFTLSISEIAFPLVLFTTI